ncbi:UNVERIFIED_CONTAM: hypothetical protein Sangu_1467700 [Sesamum angustifolium]|uniref:Uncharacterized protein n=1 Tax=Sesamum angustifolium TaxID=2727405 RepID=A0AAW2NAN4_9LAMI
MFGQAKYLLPSKVLSENSGQAKYLPSVVKNGSRENFRQRFVVFQSTSTFATIFYQIEGGKLQYSTNLWKPTIVKNRNKKKKNGSREMVIDVFVADHLIGNESQAMDTVETIASSDSAGGSVWKIKKERPMKRSKNVRKMKAVAKAISQSERSVEKISKSEGKTLRSKFFKNLYE